jgi:hypothetical protein
MEEFSDKIVYIIIGLIILVVNFATKAKKQAERPIFIPQSYDDESYETEKSVKKEEYRPEYLDSQEIILEDETKYYKPIVKETQKEKITENTISNNSVIQDFDLKKAIIYSEIINRKY